MTGRSAASAPKTPAPLAPGHSGLLQRQCACGNHAMGGECESCRGKKRLGLQAKLKISEPGDTYEQEADRVADQVMAASAHSAVSAAPPRIQRFAGQAAGVAETAPTSVGRVLAGPGRTLEPALQQSMEQRFGHDFSRVRVHTGLAAEQSAREVEADAYTVGHHIVFGAGRFAPGTHEGRRLVAHELTHVVQQSGSDAIPHGQGNEGWNPSPVSKFPPRQPMRANNTSVLQRSRSGFFSTIGGFFSSIFHGIFGFSDEKLQSYLKGLNDTGEIEGDPDSDDMARAVVGKWVTDRTAFVLTPKLKRLLILEMLDGPTTQGDEDSILDLLETSLDDDLTEIFGATGVQPKQLKSDLDGEESQKRLAQFFAQHYKNGLEGAIAGSRERINLAPPPTRVARLDRTGLLGDGTAANLGITLGEFKSYLSKQADWFVEPTLTDADRKLLWSLALLLQEGEHIGAGLANLRLADLGAASAADMKSVRAYADGAAGAAQTVRITRPDAKIARVVELGAAMQELVKFVPGPVLRVCIDQAGLETLVDEKLVAVLKTYYASFLPTIENPAEQAPLITLLRGGLAPFTTLSDWVHDLHIFTPATRVRLVANVADRSRKRPVLLVLMSGLDWNKAFLQAANLEAAVLNPINLALILQGAKTLADETARVDKTADDYGQIPKPGAKARLGQVVIAGHGEAATVEQTTPGTGAASVGDKYVSYNQAQINPSAPGDDSELLIDTLLSRMDPAAARVVFAGCLVGSHDVPETPTLANVKTAAAEINTALKANPNLRDLVNQRMVALKIKGTVQAANASTPFRSFNLNAAGKAQLSLSWDRDIGGSKADYVKTGSEPEGALRAALETWADPKLGPAWTTKEMRKHVAATAASKQWYVSLTRTAYKLALPAVGDVAPARIDNLAHRVSAWLFAGWETMANAASLAGAVEAAEAPVLYPVMLASDKAVDPHLRVVVEQAWMQADAAHEPAFLAAVGATALTTLKRLRLTPLLDTGIIDPHLAALLNAPNPAKPSQPQLLLALVIAVDRGSAMPAPVRTLLRDAAGGKRTTVFPAALGVPALLDGASELDVLRDIGLAPGAAPPKGAPPLVDEANADLDKDKTNETFISVKPREVAIAGPARIVRVRPHAKARDIGKLAVGDMARIVGTTAGWTVVDLNGKIGFVDGIIP